MGMSFMFMQWYIVPVYVVEHQMCWAISRVYLGTGTYKYVLAKRFDFICSLATPLLGN